VLEALASTGGSAPVVRLGVRELPGSGTPAQLLQGAGIDTGSIADAARELVRAGSTMRM
jgi:transketolase